ncbi:oligosaccharide flippase family protein [Tichowtungia aerotolerans]|uniref:Oligosaccharide flippase family protein n=1 Tax=Tichowtungia aerotolerans TaxID=2697043 RepID=A0A6P1M6Z2_9BACT|nr:oligosaccharide flippase family protein [Tichowtungia aerotolerans]QHI70549.1 oligosaccharide flippase family protein [Tichowtungia aerotolerans]
MSIKNGNEESGAFFSRDAITGIPWMVVTKIILFFVYFSISVLTVRLLGKEQFGIFSICTNIAGLIGVFCSLGLGAAYFRFIPELVVSKNKAGLKRLIVRISLAQFCALCAAMVFVIVGKSWFEQWFDIQFGCFLIFTVLLVGVSLLKESVNSIETSLFRARRLAVLSFVQGILWLVLLGVGLWLYPEAGTAINAQTLAYGIVYMVGAALLLRHIYRLDWRSPPYGIGKRRVIKYSGTIYLNNIIRLLMLQYTEVIFLGRVCSAGEVGAYTLGYSIPPQVIFFVPMALHMLFTAGFSEAYSRDPECLNRLISAFYKMQILLTVPIAVFGVFFAPVAVPIVFGDEMMQAGGIASAFCIIHLFPIISTPLSMAIKAKEKVYRMLPFMFLQIGVNLFLDWLFILHFKLGLWGGVFAVFGTFVSTIPFRLNAARKIIGGIWFPIGYLMRIALPLFLLAMSVYFLSQQFGLFHLFEGKVINLMLLGALGLVYAASGILLIRRLRLVREEDVADFRALDIKQLNVVFQLLVPGRK